MDGNVFALRHVPKKKQFIFYRWRRLSEAILMTRLGMTKHIVEGGSPGLVVMGDDSCLSGRGF